jgi:hypothetical protein
VRQEARPQLVGARAEQRELLAPQRGDEGGGGVEEAVHGRAPTVPRPSAPASTRPPRLRSAARSSGRGRRASRSSGASCSSALKASQGQDGAQRLDLLGEGARAAAQGLAARIEARTQQVTQRKAA